MHALVLRTGVWAALTVLLAAPLAILLAVGAPGAAVAQVEVGRRALEEADFQRAVRAFDRAERGERLDRDALVALYEGRAMARFALGDEPGARVDLRALGSLDPRHRFPAEAPPELGSMLAELVRAAGGGLALTLRWTDVRGGSAISVEVQRDAASVVRGVRIHTRVGIGGSWRTEDARSAVVTHPQGVRLYFHVEALGPGGAVLLERGSRARPMTRVPGEPEPEVSDPSEPTVGRAAVVAATAPPPIVPPGADRGREGDDLPLIVGLSVGGGVLVLAAVIIGAVLGTQGGSGVTQPSAPFVVGF